MHLIMCGSDKYEIFYDSSFMILITYIIGHYNPPVRIIDLVSDTNYVMCVNFIHKWRDIQFNVDRLRRFSWNFYLL